MQALRAMTELYPELRKRGLRVLPGGDYGFPSNYADVLGVRGEPVQDVTLLQDAANLLAILQNGAFYKLPGELAAA